MIVIQLIVLLLWLVIVPFGMGHYFVNVNETDMQSIFKRYVFGLAIMFTLFEIITVPLTFLKGSLTMVSILFSVISVILVIIAVICKKINLRIYKFKWNVTNENRVGYAALGIILLQVIYVVTHMHIDDDDAWYIGTAVTSFTTDTINLISPYTGEIMQAFPADYTLSPFPIFYAMLGKITFIHPTIIAHTLIPIFWILATYMVYYLIACRLYRKNRKDIMCFMFLLSVFNLFANFSVRSVSTFMFIRIWQGKATLCSFIVPLVYYVFMLCMEEKERQKFFFLELIVVIAGTMVSSMGVFLMSVLLGTLGLVFSVKKRDIRVALHSSVCIIPCIVQFGIYILALR